MDADFTMFSLVRGSFLYCLLVFHGLAEFGNHFTSEEKVLGNWNMHVVYL